MSREEDHHLVRQLANGDSPAREAAFDTLFRKHRDRVYNTACRVLGDRDLAADVTQDAFIAVLSRAGKFDFRAAFSTWIYRITVNRCIDVRRKRGRNRPVSLSDPKVTGGAEGTGRGGSAPTGPEIAAGTRELERAVEKAVSGLNPKLACVVVLRYSEGLGYEEIADVLELPLGTVKSRLNRAHAALSAELGPRLDDHV